MAVTSMANSSIRDSVKYRNMSAVFGAPPFALEFVVVAGGGTGAARTNRGCGGGGAGGYRSSVTGENTGGGLPAETPLSVRPGDSLALTVGGANGNSILGLLESTRGGNGSNSGTGGSGGSGGGGGHVSTVISGSVAGQGFGGGRGLDTGSVFNGGGGGGAGEVGQSANSTGRNGGDGVETNISGTPTYYAGGGGGGPSSYGSGGLGGGGNGGFTSQPGGVNTGGGGGARDQFGSGGGGGSGIIIFSLPAQAPIAVFSAGVTQTSLVNGFRRVYTVTAAGPTDTVTIG